MNKFDTNEAKKDARKYALKQIKVLHEKSLKTKSPAKLAKLSLAMAKLFEELNSF